MRPVTYCVLEWRRRWGWRKRPFHAPARRPRYYLHQTNETSHSSTSFFPHACRYYYIHILHTSRAPSRHSTNDTGVYTYIHTAAEHLQNRRRSARPKRLLNKNTTLLCIGRTNIYMRLAKRALYYYVLYRTQQHYLSSEEYIFLLQKIAIYVIHPVLRYLCNITSAMML